MRKVMLVPSTGRPIRDRIAAYYFHRVFQYRMPLTGVPDWIMADPHYGLRIAARALRSVPVGSKPYYAAMEDLRHISRLMQIRADSNQEYEQALRLQSYCDFCREKIELEK